MSFRSQVGVAAASTASERPASDSPDAPISRAATAERLLELAPLVRRRVRDRLSPRDKRLFDTQDLMSTVLRRIDRLIASGRMRATSDNELISLLLTVLDNALIDRMRVLKRLRALESEDGVWAMQLASRLHDSDGDTGSELLAGIFDSLPDGEGRLLLSLRLGGASHSMAAGLLGISPEACRQRWTSLKRHITLHIESGTGELQ